MASIEAIRRLRVQATSEGTEQVAANLNKVADAQQRVSRTSDETARVTETSARRQLSAAGAYDRLLRSVDEAHRTQQRFAAGQTVIERAFQQGVIDTQQYARSLDLLADKFGVVSLAAQRQAAEIERGAAVQARVNAVTGVSGGIGGTARGGDIDAYGKQLDDLRAKYNPLFAAGRHYKETLADINQAARVGAIAEKERADAVGKTKAAFADQVNSLRGVNNALSQSKKSGSDAAEGVGLARHELINLSRQAQDIVVSLQGGQSPFTVLLQQGSQVGDVFTSSKATVGDFARQATGWLGNFLTVGRVAFGGLALSITGATLALSSYLDSQQKVQMSLLGAGRASGQSVGSINAIAQSSSSTTGLSTTEARAFAAELASTGKIGKDNLEPIVKIGHDIATVFGVDAAEAAKLLGRAYADPVRGAEQLDARLGFLDAAMQRQIQNLVAQNRVWEAQRVLQAGVESSLVGVNEATSTSTKFWTALGNAASNAWDKIGAGLSRATGIGLKLGLDEQVAIAQSRLDSFKKDLETAQEYAKSLGPGAQGVDTGYDAAIAGVRKYSMEVEKLTSTMKQNSDATQAAQDRQRSFAQDAAMRSLMPEIGQLEAIKNQTVVLQGAIEDTRREISNLVPDEATGSRLKALTDALELFNKALDKSKAAASGFKTEFQKLSEGNAIALDAVTAFSPSARADIARRQARLNSSQDVNVEKIAQDAYNLSLKQSTVALSEAARARTLYAQQGVQSAQLEIDMLGKTIGQQAEMRANLQARQTLEQQASQNRTAFDEAEYKRLQQINAELGRKTQLAAQAAINDNISFGRQTALLSPDDVAIAQQLKGIYPDVAAGLGSVEASGLRANAALSGIGTTMSSTLTTGFADILDGTKSVSQGFGDMSKSIIRAIEEAVIKMMIVAPLMRSLQSSFGSFFGSPSSGGIPMPGDASFIGPTFATGGYTGPGTKYQPAGIVHAGEYVFSQSAVGRIGLHNLDRLHRGYAEGGPVLPAPRFSNDNRSAAGGGVTVNIHNAPAGTTATAKTEPDGNGGFNVEVMLDAANARNLAKPGSATNRVLASRGRLASR